MTPREEQVVNLVAEGIGNREIAQQLGIRENTVKKSLLRIYDKLGISNRVELVLYALTHRGAERAHIVPQNDSRLPASTNRLEADRIGIHALGRERDIDGDLTSNVLAPIHNTSVRVSDAEKFLDD